MSRRRWSDEELVEAVADSLSFSEVLRALGLRAAGGNHASVRRHIDRLGLDTSHFRARGRTRRRSVPLEDVLVPGSTYGRKHIKRRLFQEGLKDHRCELCGQGEVWRGARMSLILDHINGVHDDNRLENLRVVCPNCAATLSTHCGRNGAGRSEERRCERCQSVFVRRNGTQRFCSVECGRRGAPGERATARPGARRVSARPDPVDLRALVEAHGYTAVAERFGVSDNAVRKWFSGAGVEPPRRRRPPSDA